MEEIDERHEDRTIPSVSHYFRITRRSNGMVRPSRNHSLFHLLLTWSATRPSDRKQGEEEVQGFIILYGRFYHQFIPPVVRREC